MSLSYKRRKRRDDLSSKFSQLVADLKPEVNQTDYLPDQVLKWRKVKILQYKRIKHSQIRKYRYDTIEFTAKNRVICDKELYDQSPIFLSKNMTFILNNMRRKQKDTQLLYAFDDQWKINDTGYNPFTHNNHNHKLLKSMNIKKKNKNKNGLHKLTKTKWKLKMKLKIKTNSSKCNVSMGSYFVKKKRRSCRLH
eukprot:373635_1